MPGMETIAKRLRDLPILNIEAFRLIQYCSSPAPSMATLEGMVKTNPNLSGQIMRLANSASLKRLKPTEVLSDALVLLGMDTLKKIFVQNFYGSLGQLLQTQSSELSHGKNCAILSEFVARSAGMDPVESSKVFMGGLLHDIGKLFLAFVFPAQFDSARKMSRLEQKKSFEAEMKVFGFTHQDVGEMICATWNFPDYLGAIVKSHHVVSEGPLHPLGVPVFIANGFLNESDRAPFQPFEERLKALFSSRRRSLEWTDFREEFRKALRATS